MEKIFITGTGRCGPTFLIKLFTFLEFDTGYTRDNYNESIKSSCNAGMEHFYQENYYIIKSPLIINTIPTIISDKNVKIKQIIIPIRDYEKSVKSRVNNGYAPGGFWRAENETDQLLFYRTIMSNYLYYMTKYDIPTIFLDFDKMVSDKQYLFQRLNHILTEKNITFEHFSEIYDEASLTSKPN